MLWLKHFTNTTTASINKQVIILDGHHSHKTLEAINYARAHGITLITLPPHSTHKMQPLDITFFKHEMLLTMLRRDLLDGEPPRDENIHVRHQWYIWKSIYEGCYTGQSRASEPVVSGPTTTASLQMKTLLLLMLQIRPYRYQFILVIRNGEI